MRELDLWTDTLHLRVRNKILESIAEFSRFCLEIQLANNSNNDENKKSTFVDAPLPDVSSNHLRSLTSAVQAHSQGLHLSKFFTSIADLFPDHYVHSDQRQFKNEERVYLSNSGINVVSEALKEGLSSLIEQKGAFISSISHELRTPLHGILANCELMEESKLSEAQAELVKTIQGCGTSLMNIIIIVLDFAKLENEKQDYIEDPINQKKLVKLLEKVFEACFVGQQVVTALYNENNKIANSMNKNNDDEENLLMDENNNTAITQARKTLEKVRGKLVDVESEVGVEVVERYFKGWLKVKELICEDKENVTDSNLDGDIILLIMILKEIEETQFIERKRRKVVILTRPCGPRKLEKAIVSVLSSQEEKLLEEENSYFPKLIMTPPISEDDNSKDYINKSDCDSSLLSVAPPLRPCFNRSTTLLNLHLLSENKEPKILPIPKSTFSLTLFTSPCATPTAMSSSLPNMSESLNINPPPLNELKKSKSVNSLSCNLGSRVLVEDNAVNRIILATFLKKRGIRFDEAENGAIGVEKFKKALEDDDGEFPNRKGFDIVLIDMQMPVM
ncbi:HisKA-domain-containing protein [Rhizophagus irregularis]|uniref:HisKA-domain-containing protein n=1 Tax=Rhizophagus irregularis TaxID=588596 RepID=A0A2I1H3L3_9GLOM|nr:HisKA-domain-containing protein [Rhizophagus irregularis]